MRATCPFRLSKPYHSSNSENVFLKQDRDKKSWDFFFLAIVLTTSLNFTQLTAICDNTCMKVCLYNGYHLLLEPRSVQSPHRIEMLKCTQHFSSLPIHNVTTNRKVVARDRGGGGGNEQTHPFHGAGRDAHFVWSLKFSKYYVTATFRTHGGQGISAIIVRPSPAFGSQLTPHCSLIITHQ